MSGTASKVHPTMSREEKQLGILRMLARSVPPNGKLTKHAVQEAKQTFGYSSTQIRRLWKNHKEAIIRGNPIDLSRKSGSGRKTKVDYDQVIQGIKAMPAAKSLRHVADELDMRQSTVHRILQSKNITLASLSSHVPKDRWNEKFEELKAHKERTGEAFVPGQKTPLSKWCCIQRVDYHKGVLLADRVKALDGIGFPWAQEGKEKKQLWMTPARALIDDTKWLTRFEELKGHKEATGEVFVRGDSTALARWCAQQRKDFKAGRLSASRVKALNTFGFPWYRDHKTPASRGKATPKSDSEDGPHKLVIPNVNTAAANATKDIAGAGDSMSLAGETEATKDNIHGTSTNEPETTVGQGTDAGYSGSEAKKGKEESGDVVTTKTNSTLQKPHELRHQINEWLTKTYPKLSDADLKAYSQGLSKLGFHPKCPTICELKYDDLCFMKILHARYFFSAISQMANDC